MSSKLFVGNLAFSTTENELRDLFSAHGNVAEIFVAMDKFTGRPRGFAFVTMGSAQEAQAAIAAINGTNVGGRDLAVNEARPKEDRPNRSFGGGDRGGDRGGYGGGGGDRGGERSYGGGDRGGNRGGGRRY
ncbi:MAG: RNA-binding protein [Opitutales bacterium]